ncbi:hypothetical protein SHLO109777_07600 [Shewanella loihica]|uniref:Lipoprotein, putative n=1 Tax=Shewanella loihica (strain ATCC BAA-1088 / PV-4) TaxID=323850 RepID=A3QHR7_SHELP|nr:hypothetical protein [Shewanella loihica]ABO25015.1 lipoprotein, putative [Shewanella loihica PV-4]
MKKTLHLFGAITATTCIASFFLATILVELFGSVEQIITVKQLILMPGLFILIPAMMVTGVTGNMLGNKGRVLGAKQRRMKLAAANGLLMLLPLAIVLARMASAQEFDSLFFSLQLLELCCGAANLYLLGLNARDGMKLSGRLKQKKLTSNAL